MPGMLFVILADLNTLGADFNTLLFALLSVQPGVAKWRTGGNAKPGARRRTTSPPARKQSFGLTDYDYVFIRRLAISQQLFIQSGSRNASSWGAVCVRGNKKLTMNEMRCAFRQGHAQLELDCEVAFFHTASGTLRTSPTQKQNLLQLRGLILKEGHFQKASIGCNKEFLGMSSTQLDSVDLLWL